MNAVCMFDLDGTLIDSMPYYKAGLYKVLDDAGIAYEDDLIEILTPLGYTKSAEYYINVLGMKGSVEQIVRQMEKNLVYEYSYNIKLKPGVAQYLKKRKEEGAILCVLTASLHIVTDVCLKNNGIYDLFDHVWSVEDFELSKSGTELFFRVADEVGRPTSEIEFFDDNLTALTNCTKAGMRSYAVKDRQNEDDLRKIREIAHEFVPSFEDLL